MLVRTQTLRVCKAVRRNIVSRHRLRLSRPHEAKSSTAGKFSATFKPSLAPHRHKSNQSHPNLNRRHLLLTPPQSNLYSHPKANNARSAVGGSGVLLAGTSGAGSSTLPKVIHRIEPADAEASLTPQSPKTASGSRPGAPPSRRKADRPKRVEAPNKALFSHSIPRNRSNHSAFKASTGSNREARKAGKKAAKTEDPNKTATPTR